MRIKFDEGTWLQEDVLRFMEAEKRTKGCAKQALYEGAKIVADAVHAAAASHGTLASGVDIAKMGGSDSGADTAVGFGGYDEKGTPYKLIANVLESGTSKTGGCGSHFFSAAVARSSPAAQAAMEAKFWEVANQILNK